MQQVPQFINTQDKVAGPFTWRQLIWLGIATVIIVILYKTLTEIAFWITAIPVAVIAASFAFIKPQGLPLISFVQYLIIYLLKPRTFLWQREAYDYETEQATPNDQDLPLPAKPVTTEDISSLTETLDSHGSKTNKRLEELIQQNAKQSKKKSRKFL